MKITLTILSILLLAGTAQADHHAEGGAKIGPAGCGLGNQFFGADSQILASTTNGSSGNQTFGITSGTSNCDAGGGMAQLENFIEMNRETVANDLSRGQGETIKSLSQILGCHDSAQLGSTLKSQYGRLFSKPGLSSREIANGIHNAVSKSSALSTTCGNV